MGVFVLKEFNDASNFGSAMYATRLMTELYHLVQPGGKHTLCGLRISRATSARKTSILQLVDELPMNVAICKHCERINAQDCTIEIPCEKAKGREVNG